jgi:polyisoprenoid-binding protein YceI
MKIRFLASALALSLASVAFGDVPEWKIDPAHSSVGFNVRHFFNKVPGSFSKFEGVIRFDPENVAASSAEATIQVASVNTNAPKRDAHLQNEDFFLSEKFPAITFKSKSWVKTGDNTFDVTGDLTIKDVSREVVLKTTLLGIGPGRPGKTVSGWEATTTLNREDFGLTYGQGIVGNEVEIVLNIQAGK